MPSWSQVCRVSLLLLPLCVGIPDHYTASPITWADPSDPVLASALARLGPDWTLATGDLACRDLYDKCQKWANYTNCVDNPRFLLNYCRPTCRSLYPGLTSDYLPEKIISWGGADDIFIDQFGFKIGVCSLKEGFDNFQRDTYLRMFSSVGENIPYIPKFTKEGFWKTKIPEHLYLDLLEARTKALEQDRVFEESSPQPGTINYQAVVENPVEEKSMVVKLNRTLMIELTNEICEKLFKTLGPIAENWSGVKLKPTSVYGMRRYQNNSALISHIDKVDTHVISVIINVAQDVDEDWPLFIKDNDNNNHIVIIKPGEMVWYESARLIHSRQWPMRGRYYDNIFIHYRPRGDWYKGDSSGDYVSPISLERVKYNQRNMKKTDWDLAWASYEQHILNMDLGKDAPFQLGKDPYDENEILEFKHIS